MLLNFICQGTVFGIDYKLRNIEGLLMAIVFVFVFSVFHNLEIHKSICIFYRNKMIYSISIKFVVRLT